MLVARCEHDAVMPGPSGEMQYMNVKTLNEWDPRVGILEFLLVVLYLSHVTRKLSSVFPTRFEKRWLEARNFGFRK